MPLALLVGDPNPVFPFLPWHGILVAWERADYRGSLEWVTAPDPRPDPGPGPGAELRLTTAPGSG